jgi:hypothetical protein
MEHDPHDYRGHKAMMDLVYERDECLRYRTTLFLDGKKKRCCDDAHAIPCSHCKTLSTEVQIQGRSVLGKRTRNDDMRMAHFKTTQNVKDYMKETFGQTTEISKHQCVVRVQKLDGYVVNFKTALSKFNGIC